MTTTATATASARYVEGLNEKYDGTKVTTIPMHFTVEPGRRYDKIVKNWSGRSVHAFVERETGFVFKADGWSRPAKGVRFTSVEAALAALGPQDWAGGYLYRRG